MWRVLLDFELALTHGDRDAAESLLAEIENGRSFTEPNLSFLEVRFLAAFEEWDRLLALETLPTLLRVPRPKRVSGAIMEALVQTRVRPLLQGDVGRSGVREELGRIDRQFGPLFQSDPLPLTPSTALITALSACVTRPPRVAQYQRIVESATAAGFPILDEVQALLGDDPLPEAKPISGASGFAALGRASRLEPWRLRPRLRAGTSCGSIEGADDNSSAFRQLDRDS